jgi:hypothetical protein
MFLRCDKEGMDDSYIGAASESGLRRTSQKKRLLWTRPFGSLSRKLAQNLQQGSTPSVKLFSTPPRPALSLEEREQMAPPRIV